MNMMKMMNFDKKDKNWDCCNFYQIYMKDDVKTIKFIGITDRASQGKGYLSWICITCGDSCEMSLEDFLEWDVYYQFTKLMERTEEDNIETDLPPQHAFIRANKWVLGDGNGSCFLNLLKITEDTPCGYYYGN